MRARTKAAAIFAATLLLSPISTLSAQDRGGVPTETQDRMRGDLDSNMIWNFLGLVGILGLLGLRRGHADDSYHPTEFDE